MFWFVFCVCIDLYCNSGDLLFYIYFYLIIAISWLIYLLVSRSC